MADDIVDELLDWAEIIDGAQGRAVVAMLSGAVYRDAADEIKRLREQLEFAHRILGSETMIWLFHGSDGWQQSHISSLRDPVHSYWDRFGNVFREVRRG